MPVTCRECGQPVSPGDRTCHNCGAPDPAVPWRSRKITTIVATVVILLVIALAIRFLG